MLNTVPAFMLQFWNDRYRAWRTGDVWAFATLDGAMDHAARQKWTYRVMDRAGDIVASNA